jgi:hypothetical protein
LQTKLVRYHLEIQTGIDLAYRLKPEYVDPSSSSSISPCSSHFCFEISTSWKKDRFRMVCGKGAVARRRSLARSWRIPAAAKRRPGIEACGLRLLLEEEPGDNSRCCSRRVQGSWFGQRWRDAETQQGEIN